MELPTEADLKERRTELELTQSELADRAGVSQPLIARIEGGDVDPRLSTLRSIVNALEEAAGDVVRAGDLMNEDVVSVEPDDSVAMARDKMLDEGYSQMPVVREGSPQGIISNTDIRQVHDEQDASISDLFVREVMHDSYRTEAPDAPLEEFSSYLDRYRAVLVVRNGQLEGIITEADIAAHVS